MSSSDYNGITAQRRSAIKHRQDAKALFSVGRPRDQANEMAKHPHGRGAMYLAGYAIECKLKAIAMEVYRCFTLEQLAARLKVDEREVYTHGLESLDKHLPRLLTSLQVSPVARFLLAGQLLEAVLAIRPDGLRSRQSSRVPFVG